MPSILDYAANSRNMRPSIELDLTMSGNFEDFTGNLEYITIYSTLDNEISGLYEITMDAEFTVSNPSDNWVKAGRPVQIKVQTSDDDYTTSHTEILFTGVTERQSTVPVRSLKIRAKSINSMYLDKKAARQVFIDEDVNDIIESLLLEVGVPAGQIDLSATGTVVPVYAISNNVPIRDYIIDLLKPDLQIAGFDRNSIFRATKVLKLSALGGTITPDLSLTVDQVVEFSDQDLTGNYYCNTIEVTGRSYEYLTNTQLYYNTQLTNYEIRPGGKLYVNLEIPDTTPIAFDPFQPIGTVGTYSFYEFYDNPDGTGMADNSQITLVSESIAEKDGKDTIFLVFENASLTTSYYLRVLIVNGDAVRKLADLSERRQSTFNLTEDGKEIVISLDSNAIQSTVLLGDLATTMQVNLWNYAQVYKLECAGRPDAQIGKVIQFQDRYLNTFIGSILETDTALVSAEKDKPLYGQSITIKRLITGLAYASWDAVGVGWDNADYSIF